MNYPPLSITWFPTRKCNLSCEYCRIADNHFRKELSFEDALIAMDKINQRFPDLFWCILGGDSTAFGRTRLLKLMSEFDRHKIFYGLVSNSKIINKTLAEQLVNEGGLTNWTVSVDSLSNLTGYRGKKASYGLNAIQLFRALHVKDLHATITVTRNTLSGLPELVKFLSALGVWSEITPIHYAKSSFYDFASFPEDMPDMVFNKDDINHVDEIMHQIIEMKHAGYLVHNLDEYLLDWKNLLVGLEWSCKHYSVLTIDADGNLRPCIHIYGNKLRKINALTLHNYSWDDIQEAFYQDKKVQCRGCLWNCSYESELVYEATGSLDEVYAYFDHGAIKLDKSIAIWRGG